MPFAVSMTRQQSAWPAVVKASFLILIVGTVSLFAGAQSPCPLAQGDRVVTICLPSVGEAYDSPLHVLGAGVASHGVRMMQVYLDGVKVFERQGSVADTNLIVTPGSHRVTLQALDMYGTFKKSVAVTVGSRSYPRFAYVANPADKTVSTFLMEGEGGFLRQNGYVLAGEHPSGVAETWRGFVYATGGSDGKVYAYKKTYGGRLIGITGSPFACGVNCTAVAISGPGTFLYAVDANSDALRGYKIDATTGALTEIAGSPFASGGTKASAVAISARGMLFVTNEGSNTVSGFAIDPVSGALTAVPGSPTATGVGPHALALNATGDRLYVADGVDHTIYAYDVSDTGSLQKFQVVNGAAEPTALTVYPSGAFLYVTQIDRIAAYKVDFAGALHGINEYANTQKPSAVAVDRQGKYLLVANANAPYELWEYKIDLTTGELKFVRGTRMHGAGAALAVSAGSAPVAISPGFVYAGTADRSNFVGKVFGFSIGSTGTLTPVAGSPYSHPRGVTTLATHPSGAMLYAPGLKLPDAFSGLVAQYWVNRSSGALSAAAPYIHLEEFETHNMMVEASGRFAYATSGYGVMEPWNTGWSVPASGGPLGGWLFYPDPNPWDNLSIDPLGKYGFLDSTLMGIDAVTGQWWYGPSTGFTLEKLVYDPTGRFAWALAGDTIQAYSISGSTGWPKPMGSALATGSGAQMIAVEPYGRFVYVANKVSNSVSAYKASLANGSLTPVGTQAFPAGTGPVGLVADATGKFLYVVNETSMDVSAFAINQTSGGLTSVAGSPVHLGAAGAATAVTTVPKIQ